MWGGLAVTLPAPWQSKVDRGGGHQNTWPCSPLLSGPVPGSPGREREKANGTAALMEVSVPGHRARQDNAENMSKNNNLRPSCCLSAAIQVPCLAIETQVPKTRPMASLSRNPDGDGGQSDSFLEPTALSVLSRA